MVKIYSHVAGKTLGSHEKILKSLKGAQVVSSPEESDAIVVFCPIVSRFETDVQSALSSISGNKKVILVAMHHTFDPNYTTPSVPDNPAVHLLVHVLFYDKKGLLKCPRNKQAKKEVCEELGLKKKWPWEKPQNQKEEAELKKPQQSPDC